MSKKAQLVMILLALCVLLTVIPFVISSGSSFDGADNTAKAAVEELSPGYKPWAEPIAQIILGKEIPAETQTLLFCLQSAIGSGILCFGFGYLVARKKYSKEK